MSIRRFISRVIGRITSYLFDRFDFTFGSDPKRTIDAPPPEPSVDGLTGGLGTLDSVLPLIGMPASGIRTVGALLSLSALDAASAPDNVVFIHEAVLDTTTSVADASPIDYPLDEGLNVQDDGARIYPTVEESSEIHAQELVTVGAYPTVERTSWLR